MSTISALANVIGSGARANKYRLAFSYPSAVSGTTTTETVDVLCKTAIAPQKEIGQIELYNQGRKLVIPGDTVYDNAFAVDFYLTEDHAFRYDIVKWMDSCDHFQKNVHTGNPGSIMTDLRLEQLDSAGNVTAQYTMHYAYPTTVGEVSYGDENQDTVLEFNVTFAYTDWVIGTSEFSEYSPTNATENETAL